MPLAPHVRSDCRGALRLTVFHGIEQFESEIITARCELADGRTNQVISNDSGNRSRQTCRSRNKSFGDAGSHRTQRRSARGSEPMKCVNDAPNRAEQPDEGRYSGCNGQPRYISFQPGNLFGGSDLHPALNRQQISNRPTSSGLTTVLLVATFEYSHQWAGLELVRDRGNILQALRLAEGTHKAPALRARTPQQAPFGQDNGP